MFLEELFFIVRDILIQLLMEWWIRAFDIVDSSNEVIFIQPQGYCHKIVLYSFIMLAIENTSNMRSF